MGTCLYGKKNFLKSDDVFIPNSQESGFRDHANHLKTFLVSHSLIKLVFMTGISTIHETPSLIYSHLALKGSIKTLVFSIL